MASRKWGSLLSGAVAGLESRLDNIFAEEEERAAKEKAIAKDQQSQSQTPSSSNATATNDRLKERLAKAVAKSSSQPVSEQPSRVATPSIESSSLPPPVTASPRLSSTSSRLSTELSSQSEKPIVDTQPSESPVATTQEPSATLLTSGLPINPARFSEDTSEPPPISVETEPLPVATPDGRDTPSPLPPDTRADADRQEEMHAHLERIDALQAKLHYLARETVAAAKEANASAQPGSFQQKIAEKDERIALLMDEGNNLSKTEMRNLAIIKKLRIKTAEEEKAASELRKRLSKLEQSEADLKQKLKQAEQSEKLADDRLKQLQKLDKQLESTKNELEESKATVSALRKQLADAEQRADDAERISQDKSFKVDSEKLTELQKQLEDLKIEKKSAEDRFSAELKRSVEQAERQNDQHTSREAELMAEVSNLESRIEALRSRAEAASSDVTGDTHAKLLRQVETLQTQYSLAAENWRTIEASLNSRIAAIEKERDEVVKREADIRKKARDVSSKSRRVEEELERVTDESQTLAHQLQTQTTEKKLLQTRLEATEKSLEEAKADLERQKGVFESELHQKLEEQKSQQMQQMQQGLTLNTTDLGRQSPTSHFRKSPAPETLNPASSSRRMQRVPSHEQTSTSISRRPSAMMTPTMSSPGVSRQGSAFSLSQLNGLSPSTSLTPGNNLPLVPLPSTPSIHPSAAAGDYYNDYNDDARFDDYSSPQRTINDMISATTVHTGPSVQLVERMSSSIRRLESEKAAHKDELARLVAQRDDSRNQVVELMREQELARVNDETVAKLKGELEDVKKRYEACLEMLGEREEEVLDLKADVGELKRIYRDLADRSLK